MFGVLDWGVGDVGQWSCWVVRAEGKSAEVHWICWVGRPAFVLMLELAGGGCSVPALVYVGCLIDGVFFSFLEFGVFWIGPSGPSNLIRKSVSVIVYK